MDATRSAIINVTGLRLCVRIIIGVSVLDEGGLPVSTTYYTTAAGLAHAPISRWNGRLGPQCLLPC